MPYLIRRAQENSGMLAGRLLGGGRVGQAGRVAVCLHTCPIQPLCAPPPRCGAGVGGEMAMLRSELRRRLGLTLQPPLPEA